MLHRRHPLQPLADWLADDPAVQHLALGPLPARDIEQLVCEAAEAGSRANFLPSIVEGSRGNPLVALWLASSTEILAGVRLSDPFDELCGARLEALPRDAIRVVRTLSAAGIPLPRATLLRVQLPEGRVTIQGIEAAVGSGFVVEQGDRVSIAHELLAEAVDALELISERRGVHVALAQQLVAQPALAAWHWAQARRPVEARDAFIRAATAALNLDPAETVLGHYEEALELPGLEEMTPEERAALWAGAAAASASAGRFRRAAGLQRRAIENRARREASSDRGGRDAGTRLLLGEMYADLGRYQWAGGELEGAIESMERALGIMPDQPSRIRARAQAALAQHLMIAGRFEESADLAREACATADAAAADEETRPSAVTPSARWAWTWPTWATWKAAWRCSRRAAPSRGRRDGSTTSCAWRPTARPCWTSTRGARRRWPSSTPASRMRRPAGWRPRTAPSCEATAPTSSITSDDGRRRRPSAGWRRTGA